MGSLYSKPKIPEPVYSTPAAATPVTAAPVAAETAAVTPADSSADSEKAASIARRRSLPQTVLTSFRGVLSQGDWVPARKSLLGE